MASLLRPSSPHKSEPDQSPEAVEARVRTLGERCAAEHGGRPSDFSLGAYRVEYEKLWQRYRAECIPFLSPEWGDSDTDEVG
jgi:hypothetical protein